MKKLIIAVIIIIIVLIITILLLPVLIKEDNNNLLLENNINNISPIENNIGSSNENNNETSGNTTTVVNQTIVRGYIDNFIQIAKEDVNKAYNLLDEEYKVKKFGNIDNFKNYLTNNLEKIQNSAISKYNAKDRENYIEYYYVDSNNNTFIIKKLKNKEDFTILLDEYTIKEEDYINDYNKLNDSQKVYNNIFIFFRMINEKEYKSAYGLLDENFKNNNFATVAEFEEYAKSHFWNNNTLTITKIEKQGDIYTGNLRIASGVGLSAEETIKTFAIQLKENAEFVLSFGI